MYAMTHAQLILVRRLDWGLEQRLVLSGSVELVLVDAAEHLQLSSGSSSTHRVWRRNHNNESTVSEGKVCNRLRLQATFGCKLGRPIACKHCKFGLLQKFPASGPHRNAVAPPAAPVAPVTDSDTISAAFRVSGGGADGVVVVLSPPAPPDAA
jgi:hypothetical protein